jgi:predicted nucleic acid-binding protein
LPVASFLSMSLSPGDVTDRQPERDAMIAATALVHGLTVVSRNIADFRATGVALLNPWNPA